MTLRYIMGGLRFFVVSLVLGFALLAIAPIDVIRAFCALAIVGATAGCVLHLAALRRMSPETWAELRQRASTAIAHLYGAVRRISKRALDAVGPAHTGGPAGANPDPARGRVA